MSIIDDMAQDVRFAHTLPREPCRSAHAYLAVQRMVNLQKDTEGGIGEPMSCALCQKLLYIDWYPPEAIFDSILSKKVTIMHIRVVPGPSGHSEYYPTSLLDWPEDFDFQKATSWHKMQGELPPGEVEHAQDQGGADHGSRDVGS